MIRDILAGRTPLIMRGEIYATSALAGSILFVVLDELTAVSEPVSAVAGAVTIFGLRLVGFLRQWALPSLGGA